LRLDPGRYLINHGNIAAHVLDKSFTQFGRERRRSDRSRPSTRAFGPELIRIPMSEIRLALDISSDPHRIRPEHPDPENGITQDLPLEDCQIPSDPAAGAIDPLQHPGDGSASSQF
jgi:hypothetical protein